MEQAERILLTIHAIMAIAIFGGIGLYSHCRGERECIPDSITKLGV